MCLHCYIQYYILDENLITRCFPRVILLDDFLLKILSFGTILQFVNSTKLKIFPAVNAMVSYLSSLYKMVIDNPMKVLFTVIYII